MPARAFDCLVVGAGPAGAALALRLARWDRAVALVHAPGPPRAMREETVEASFLQRLVRDGLEAVASECVRPAPARRGVGWGSDDFDWRDSADGESALHVERELFDRALRRQARAAGASLFEEARVEGPLLPSAPVRVRTRGGEAFELDAPVRVAAVGRAAIGALGCARAELALPATVALTAELAPPPGASPVSAIEAVREGWIWWLALRSGAVSVTVFADRAELGARGRDALWRAALAGALGPARASCAAPARGADASARLMRARGAVLLAGEAAAGLDPLSGQGLESALASAEHCAYAVNTLLEDPGEGELVQAERHAWERGLFGAHRRLAGEFYRREPRFADAPFWRARRALVNDARAESRGALPHFLRPHPALEEVPKLRRAARRFVRCRGFRLRGADESFERAGRFELAALVELLGAGATIDELFERARRHPSFVAGTPAALVEALGAMHALGMLGESAG